MAVFLRCAAGFALGWAIYLAAMVVTVYEGWLSLVFQPLMAAVFSGVFVAAALLAGLPLRVKRIRAVWYRAGWRPLLLTVGAIGVMVLHAPLGLEVEWIHPETDERVRTMEPTAAAISYFLAIFPIVNLPPLAGRYGTSAARKRT